MSDSIGMDEFATHLESMLRGMSSAIDDRVEPCVKKAVRSGAKVAKSKAPRNPNIHLSKGPYKDSLKWKVSRDSSNRVQGVVYSKHYPGLVHLLEKGHARTGGGKVNGIKHMMDGKKIADKTLVNEIDKMVGDVIGEI